MRYQVQVGKKWLLLRYTYNMSIVLFWMGICFSHLGMIQCQLSIISCLIDIIHCGTSAIFCDMPIILCLVFIIYSAMLSINFLLGIIYFPIAITLSLLYSFIPVHRLEFPVSGANSTSTQYKFKNILSCLQFPVSLLQFCVS